MSDGEDLRFLLFSHPAGLLILDQVWPRDAAPLSRDRRAKAKQICQAAYPEKRWGSASTRGAAEVPGLHVVAVPAEVAGVAIGMSVDELLQILTRDRYVAFVEFG